MKREERKGDKEKGKRGEEKEGEERQRKALICSSLLSDILYINLALQIMYVIKEG